MGLPVLVAAVLSLIVGLTAAPAGAAADKDCLRVLRGVDLQTADVLDLQKAMNAGRVTSADLVDAYIARIGAYDTSGPLLNSVRVIAPTAKAQAAALDAERRAGMVRGPLHGIPILLKDNVGTRDVPTTAGSIALEGSIPVREAYLTERLRAAGAVILGKANLSEFANWVQLGMPNGYSSLGGQVVNAYDGGDPSGSSSGSGVAASMALATTTIGSETSLSILAPTLENSLVGVKPTLGLVSRAGIIPLSPSFDTAGPMGRNVTDAAAVLAAVSGPDPRDPATADAKVGDFVGALKPDALKGKRLAFSRADADSLGSESRALWDATMEKLTALGATLVEVNSLDQSEIPLFGLEAGAIPNDFKYSLNKYLAEEATNPPTGVRTLTDIIEYNRRHPDRVKYGQNLLEASDATPGNRELALAQSTPAIQAARATIDAALIEGDADAIIAPDYLQGRKGAAAGYPTIMIPLGYPGGARMGLAFMGTAYTDADLVGYAYATEQVTKARVPPTAIEEPFAVPGSCAAASKAPFAEVTAASSPAKAKAKKKTRLRKCNAKARKKKGAARKRALKACKRKYGRKRKSRPR